MDGGYPSDGIYSADDGYPVDLDIWQMEGVREHIRHHLLPMYPLCPFNHFSFFFPFFWPPFLFYLFLLFLFLPSSRRARERATDL